MSRSVEAMDERSELSGRSAGPPTSCELSSTHAQLLLIGEAIRAAAADLAIPPPHTEQQPQRPKSSQTGKLSSTSPTAPAASATAAAAGAEVPLTRPLSGSLNGVSIKSSTTQAAPVKPILITATDRLAALHDHLRRVQWLMKEYETVCQRAVEMHLLPSTEDASLDGAEQAGEAKKSTPVMAWPAPPSPSQRAAAPLPQRPDARKQSSNNNGGGVNVKKRASTAADPNTEKSALGPSLHQRRALASDAAFTRFCGLRVDPEHLLLPWTTPTGNAAPAFETAGRPIQEKDDKRASLNGIDIPDVQDSERPDSASSSVSASSGGSGHSQASTSLRAAQQQRQQAAATAHLSAYSRFFLHPKSPLMVAPAFTEAAKTGGATALDTYLASPAASSSLDPVNGPAVLLRHLRDTQSQFESLRRCRLFGYEGRLRALKTEATALSNQNDEKMAVKTPPAVKRIAGQSEDEPKWEHTSVMVERMSEVLAALRIRFASESHYAHCGTPAVTLGRQLHAWTQPLLRQLNELLSNPSLEDVDQDLREKLRRMKFDVEELQQEQADAIANGDMQRSEELYYEQTALSEAMKGPYDEMEQLLQEYADECVALPLAALQGQRETLNARLTRVIEEHAGRLTEVAQDIDRVKEKRRTVIQSRHRQRNAMSAYQHTWKKQWLGNGDQQMACYRAMEQLERRLSSLQKAQSVLAEDWLARMALERQREEDAAAFTCFAEARTQALTESQRNLQSVVDGLRLFSGAIHFSCSHAEAFARDVLQGHVSETQLALRKDRLAQFRSLYLTLGDWRFKKSRNAEEIQKKIEYYTLQQEVAMDVMNPKAKEYSQAKQQWEAAKAEALVQLGQLDDRSRLQLEAFRPTEQLLREAGVDFVSPEDELAERTLQRTQRLVEYQQLIEEGIGVRSSSKGPATAPAITEGPRRRLASNGQSSAFAATHRLPALTPSATTPARPLTADIQATSTSFPPRPTERAADSSRSTLSLASSPPAVAAVAASPSASFHEGQSAGSGGGVSSLPPIAGRSNTPPPRLHSTEERIMHDVSKTAAMGGMVESGKRQKRKSTK